MSRLEDEPWNASRDELARLDQEYSWHPFTQMQDWCAPGHQPLLISSGEGAILTDHDGNEYIDGNASIWTNVHGHGHPRINAAIREQLDRVAHTSFLGFTHPAAAVLSRELVERAPEGIAKCFFSDDGSTANEVALRMAIQYRQEREEDRPWFVAFDQAYHGDTMGAANLGGIPLFKKSAQAPFPQVHIVRDMMELESLGAEFAAQVNCAIIEPLVQGPAGIRPWPAGMLRQLREWCDQHGVLLALDEVMTGFGRTGSFFACEQEEVSPDFLNLAKGISGGYLPLAATLTTNKIFDAFLGGPEKTLYYGHSYTANPLGCAAALASLAIFDEEKVIEGLAPKIEMLAEELTRFEDRDDVIETRQCGLASAIEFKGTNAHTRTLAKAKRLGHEICLRARAHGLLTRPILNSVLFLPPLCISKEEIRASTDAIGQAAFDLPGD